MARVVLPGRDLRYYLDLACGQIRRYGRRDPIVLIALLRMLRDLASVAADPRQQDEVVRQVTLIEAEVPNEVVPEDAQAVHDMAQRVRLALAGDVLAAFRDRAGETHSI